MSSASNLANETTAKAISSPPSCQTMPGPSPLWVRLAMPSLADLIFIVTFWCLTLGMWGMGMLGDAGTGWHIRNGDHILATRSVPHVDYFSYTMSGRPWYAWEWLYDVVLACAHRLAGLNGVVVLSAAVVALTFALLFRLAARSSGNVAIAAALTIASIAASSIHFLARPHVVTWLFVVVWFAVLDNFRRDAEWRKLLWLPALMLLWVNLHGGFLLGLMLPMLFAAANVWTASICACPKKRARNWTAARRLALVTLASFAVTFANPYGYKLYVHLRDYLGSGFLMTNISEFLSPDFHSLQVKFFLFVLLTGVLSLALTQKPRAVDILLIAFACYAGLYAARNIPIACILVTLTSAPLLSAAINSAGERSDLSLRSRRFAASAQAFAGRMKTLDDQLSAHLLPVVFVLVMGALALTQGRIGSHQLLDLKFDAKKMPVEAAEYLAANNVRHAVFTEDGWGGYLIYRFYPQFEVFLDDRHDFYGEAFIRDYLDAARLRPNWRDVLDKYGVKYVMVPRDSALATALRSAPAWSIVHEDGTAVIFSR